jgi:hypothetical protein
MPAAVRIAAAAALAYNMDCIYRRDKLSFLTSDINGSAALEAAIRIGVRFVEAAEEGRLDASGHPREGA